MKINRVDHIGIAVPNLQEAKKFYEETLGIKITKEDEIVEEQKVKVSFVPCGDCEIELLESTTEDGPIAKYLAKNGGRSGIQHIALNVDNIEEAIAEIERKRRSYRLMNNLVTALAIPALHSFIQKLAVS